MYILLRSSKSLIISLKKRLPIIFKATGTSWNIKDEDAMLSMHYQTLKRWFSSITKNTGKKNHTIHHFNLTIQQFYRKLEENLKKSALLTNLNVQFKKKKQDSTNNEYIILKGAKWRKTWLNLRPKRPLLLFQVYILNQDSLIKMTLCHFRPLLLK